jgi:hypothetical protein
MQDKTEDYLASRKFSVAVDKAQQRRSSHYFRFSFSQRNNVGSFLIYVLDCKRNDLTVSLSGACKAKDKNHSAKEIMPFFSSGEVPR